ncbi:MAG TPA: hypothetical protein VJT72_12995, partial [Pseudonocardiaceae bacterium]|nr:hypothetical protein [Pseudonocardiaceae bacterium]
VSTGTPEPEPEPRPIDIVLSQHRGPSAPGNDALQTDQPAKITNSIRTSCQSQFSGVADSNDGHL